MADKKDTHKEFSTCFENFSFAEVMQKMRSHGTGSLCAEMMRKIMGGQGEGARFNCPEMMQKIMRQCGTVQEEAQKSNEEVCHGRKE